MIPNLFSPVEDNKHDCATLAISELLQTLQRYSYGPNEEVLCVFGDPAYPLRRHLLASYNGAQLTQNQIDFNNSMIKIRVTVEWMFGEVMSNNNPPTTDYRRLTHRPTDLPTDKIMFRSLENRKTSILQNANTVGKMENYASAYYLFE